MAPPLPPVPYRVVIDANVLCYLTLARLLLGLARSSRLFLPFWSAQILEEVKRTYGIKFKRGAQYAHARLAEFTVGFPAAMQADLEPLIAQCTNDEKDRHVLAAAIKAQAQVIVTFNQKHFGPEHLNRWGLVAISPEDLLLDLYSHHPDAVWRQLALTADTKHMELDALLRSYSAQQLGHFTARLLADL